MDCWPGGKSSHNVRDAPALETVRMVQGMRRSTTYRIHRSGSLIDDASAASEAMDAFADSAKTLSPVLVIAREDGDIVQYLVLRGRGDHSLARRNLQDAVAAKLEPIGEDETLVLDGRGAAKLSVPVWQQTGRENQAGKNPYVVADRAAASLAEDRQWIAVAFRAPNSIERRKWEAHLRSRGLENHHSLGHSSVLASFTAGGADASSNRQALSQVAASMPGFDEITTQVQTSVISRMVTALAVLIVSITAGVALGFGAAWVLRELAAALSMAELSVWAARAPGTLGKVGLLVGVVAALPSLLSAWSMSRAKIPVTFPRFRKVPVKDPTKVTAEDGSTRTVGGRRPLRRDVFKVSPGSFVGIVAPHVGSESGANATRDRSVPAELTQRIGPVLGVDNRGRRGHLPAVSSYEGTAVTGAAGKGKTQFQAVQWAFQLMERMNPSGRPSFPGRDNAMVFFDTKGDTWRLLKSWCDFFGVDATVVHVADDPWATAGAPGAPRRPNSGVVDILASRGTALDRARHVADMLKQSLDAGSVQGQSLETLTKVFAGAFAVTDEMVEAAREVADSEGVLFIAPGEPVTVVSLAAAFLGEPDFRAGELLYAQLKDQSQRDRAAGRSSSDAVLATMSLSTMYGPDVTPAVRRTVAMAPRNKVALLQAAPHFWDLADHGADVGSFRPGSVEHARQAAEQVAGSSVAAADPVSGFTEVPGLGDGNPFAQLAQDPELLAAFTSGADDAPGPVDPDVDATPAVRRVWTWDRLLEDNHVVIINTGVAPESGTDLTHEANKLISSLAFLSMKDAIRRVCSEWRDQGRRVTIMADELSMIAEDNVETIEWLRDKGRSFGVELSLATQRQNQLPERVKRSFLGFGTLITLVQDDELTADEIARNISADGSDWSKEDIVNLPLYSVIVRTRTDRRQPAFTLRLEDFEADRSRFVELQEGTARLSGEAAA